MPSIETPFGDGYLTDGAGPPVLVLHAWWGLVPFITEYCDRLADSGFTAFCPDLYAGRTATTVAAADELSDALDGEAATVQVATAARWLRERAPGPLSAVGFSLGAFFALPLAFGPEPPDRVVCYYGTAEVPSEATTSTAVLGHFAEVDDFEEPEWVAKVEAALRAAGSAVEFHHYADTGHWFAENDRPEFQPAAAELAWQRTVAFLRAAG